MRLAILFWFYKDLPVCINRLRILRNFNPSTQICGLYGGPAGESAVFEEGLSPFLDDFFCYPFDKDPDWKWRNGDFLINEWFRARGHGLEWDTIVVVQWDMLLMGSVADIFFELKKGEILLSGVRSVEDVASDWFWVTSGQRLNHAIFKAFSTYLLKRHRFNEKALACHFVVACLPRSFLEEYSSAGVPELGFVEYRLPTFAKLFNTPFCESKRFDSWWSRKANPPGVRHSDTVIRPTGKSIPFPIILLHLLRRGGSRVFHPFVHPFPIDIRSAVSFVFASVASAARKVSAVLS
jgi:hypothetical protein